MKKFLDLDGLTHFWNKVKQSFGIRENSESIKAGDIRFLAGKENAGKVLMYTQDGTTSEQEPDFTYDESLGIIFPEYKDLNAVPLGLAIPNPLPYTPDGFVPALGQETTRETYPVWNYIEKHHPELILSEEEWQSKASAQNGHVPYYSSGNGSTTFRFPCILHYFNATAVSQSIGGYAQEGLPNIEGSAGSIVGTNPSGFGSLVGCFSKRLSSSSTKIGTDSGWSANNLNMDASLSNPIYGNSGTVRPETCYGQWIIKAYGVTPTADEMTAAGIVQSVTNIETELAKDRIKTFTGLAQLGLSYKSVTFDSLVQAMPPNSMLIMPVATGTTSGSYAPNLNVPHNGQLVVIKGDSMTTATTFDLVELANRIRHSYGRYSTYPGATPWSGWYTFSAIAEQVQNNTTGYIKYADGRLKQWGRIESPELPLKQTVTQTINFPLAFSNGAYTAKVTIMGGTTGWATTGIRTSTRNTTTLAIAYYQFSVDGQPITVDWEAEGWWR